MATAGKPIKCKAAVVWQPNQPYSIEQVEVAVPKKNEVRIRMTSTGLCHSDLHFQEGVDKNWYFPALLGHEGAGIIESVGEGVTRFEAGDTVIPTYESYCRECDYCMSPMTNACRKQPRNNMQMDGTSRVTCKGEALSQMGSFGTFSEYTVTSEYNVAKVNPKANPNSLCLAGCCIPSGYGAAMNAAKVPPGSTVVVFGLGGIGMCVVMGCRDSGAARIIGVDINPKKFELAKEFGATEFLNPNEVASVPEALEKMTNGGADICFVSVGIIPVMEQAFESSHPHWGKTVILGLTDIGSKMKAGVWELLYGRQLLGTYFGSYKLVRDIPHLVDMVVSGKIPLEKLITHRLPLSKIEEGFGLMKRGESLRAIIDFDLK